MLCPSKIQKSPSDEVDFLTTFVRMVERLSVEELRMFGYVARQIWLRQNDVVFNGQFKSLGKLVQAARLQMEQYDQASACRIKDESTKGSSCIRTHVRWVKPPAGIVKINWDAALDERTGNAGLGIIARDHEGRTIAMQCSSFKHISNPTTAKTLAARKAVVLGVQLGVIYMELEGDAKEVVQGINCANNSAGRDGSVLNDIKTLLQNFNTWKVIHVNRGANGAAHSVARMALSVVGDHIWFENFPLSVQEIVGAEQAQVMN
jgi:ribonuclease HI